MSESICTCGAGTVCDRTCAGALAQQQECEERGHLTANGVRAANGDKALPVSYGDFCFRCGATV